MKRQIWKRFLILTLCAAMLFTTTACNTNRPGSSDEPKEKTELIIGLNSDITTLDIDEGMGSATATACLNIFDTLTRSDSTGNPQPWLAESFEVLSDTVWQFKLRKGVTFTNGEPVNAEAVKYSFDRQVNPEYAFSLAGDYSNIDRVEIVDEYTVNFVTKEPFPMLPVWLTYLGILPPAYTEEAGLDGFASNPIGSGPYKMVEWVKDSHLTLTANEDYFMGAPAYKTLTFKIIPEDSTRILALQAGEIDIAVLVPPSQIEQINATDGISVVSGPTSRPIYMGMNTIAEGPLQDVRVRQALCYALDVPAIINSVLLGNAEQIAALSLPCWAGNDTSIKPYERDLAKAAALLAEAGYPNGEGLSFNLDVVSGEYPAIKEVAQAISGHLAEAGIAVSVVTMDKSTFRSSLKDKSADPLYITGFGGMTSCNPNIVGLILSGGQRYCCYNDPILTDLIAQGTVEMDTDKFNEIWSEIQQMTIKDAPVASLYQLYGIYGISDEISWTPRLDEAILAFEITPAK